MDGENNKENRDKSGDNRKRHGQYLSPPPPSSETPRTPTRYQRGWRLAQVPAMPPLVSTATAESSSSQAQPKADDNAAATVRLLEYLTDNKGNEVLTGQYKEVPISGPLSSEAVELVAMNNLNRGNNNPSLSTHRSPKKGKRDSKDKKDEETPKLRGGASGNCFQEPCGCLGYWLAQICSC